MKFLTVITFVLAVTLASATGGHDHDDAPPVPTAQFLTKMKPSGQQDVKSLLLGLGGEYFRPDGQPVEIKTADDCRQLYKSGTFACNKCCKKVHMLAEKVSKLKACTCVVRRAKAPENRLQV